MDAARNGDAGPSPDTHWFAVVAASDRKRILEAFPAQGWHDAILTYAERQRNHAYREPAVLTQLFRRSGWSEPDALTA